MNWAVELNVLNPRETGDFGAMSASRVARVRLLQAPASKYRPVVRGLPLRLITRYDIFTWTTVLRLKCLLLTVFLCISARAQISNGIFVSVTATQALVRFTAPLSPACTLQMSEDANLSPLEADVDPALFA